MIYADAHIHITQIPNWSSLIINGETSPVCACAHSPEEWNKLLLFSSSKEEKIVTSLGIHPQNPNPSFIGKLETILEQNKNTELCNCIGEAGFDLFTAEYKNIIQNQIEVWNAQIELCQKYNLPIIVHCRHALHKIFEDAKKLSKIPSVIFHSFPGSPQEAQSILKRNINAFFSFGKPLLNGNKRAILCAKTLPIDTILAETDAPYQTLKGEDFTPASDIIKVYKKIAELRSSNTSPVCNSIEKNFYKAFNI